MVSVVVAARNEAESIGSCIQALLHQTYPQGSYEVIVVDDGSNDDTLKIAREFLSETVGPKFIVISAAEDAGISGSKKRALALGIARASGEIVLTTDADCGVPPGWIAAMASRFASRTGMVIGYSAIRSIDKKLDALAGWEAVDFLHLMAAAASSVCQGRAMAASGQSLGFRRTAFYGVGGYSRIIHRVSGDDTLLMQLIRRSGNWRLSFCLDSDAHVIHPPSSSFSELFAKRVRWASNAPCHLRLDLTFFLYLANTFVLNFLLVVSPALVVVSEVGWYWVSGTWLTKALAETVLFAKSRQIFQRKDLRWHFLVWVLTQPLYITVMGFAGIWGRFSWKGVSSKWGENPLSGAEVGGIANSQKAN